jgi:hypothetical protein
MWGSASVIPFGWCVSLLAYDRLIIRHSSSKRLQNIFVISLDISMRSPYTLFTPMADFLPWKVSLTTGPDLPPDRSGLCCVPLRLPAKLPLHHLSERVPEGTGIVFNRCLGGGLVPDAFLVCAVPPRCPLQEAEKREGTQTSSPPFHASQPLVSVYAVHTPLLYCSARR